METKKLDIEKQKRRKVMVEILKDSQLSDREKFDKLNEKGIYIHSLSELRRLKFTYKY